jgi:hypothetical protein
MIPSEPITNGQGTEPVQTLGQCFLRAEGLHSRRMVLWWETAGTPHEMPAWRFYRQVIRLALFMRERLGLIANDRVLVASPLRAERVIAEWATVILGGLAIGLDGEAAEGVSFSRAGDSDQGCLRGRRTRGRSVAASDARAHRLHHRPRSRRPSAAGSLLERGAGSRRNSGHRRASGGAPFPRSSPAAGSARSRIRGPRGGKDRALDPRRHGRASAAILGARSGARR